MTNRVRMVLILMLGGASQKQSSADSLKVWPESGSLIPNKTSCGETTREALRVIINRTPIITVRGSVMAIVVENHANNFVSKRADRVLEGVRCRDGTVRTYGFWDEGPYGTLVVATPDKGDKRPMMMAIIRNKDNNPCYERWVGMAEVQ